MYSRAIANSPTAAHLDGSAQLRSDSVPQASDLRCHDVMRETGYLQLLKRFSEIPDSRGDLGKRHRLDEVLFIALVGLLAGANDAEGMVRFAVGNILWFKGLLVLKHGVPSHDTILRLLAVISTSLIEGVLRAWVESLRSLCGEQPAEGWHLAFDGKTLRGSFDKASGAKAIHSVSAYLSGLGVALGQVVVGEKSNEITAIPDLIKALNIKGATVTIDAMGCQRDIAQLIIAGGGNYMLQVKDNQRTLLLGCEQTAADIARQRPVGEARPPSETYREVDKGHGRIETRSCTLMTDLEHIENRLAWAGLTKIAVIARERHHVLSGKTSKELAYFILSDPKSTAKTALETARSHWAIENGLHWVLDVSYAEDKQRVRDRNAAEALGILRRISAGLIKQAVGERMSSHGLREICGWNPAVLLRVLAGEKISTPAKRRTLDPKRPRVPKVARYKRVLSKP